MRALLGKATLGRESNIWQLFRGQPDLLSLLNRAASTAAESTPTGLVGSDGSPWTLHMVDVRDAVEGVYLALTHPDALGEAFNITAARPTPHTEGAAIVSRIVNVPELIIEMPFTWRLEMRVDKARDVLGYRPKHDYASMVQSGQTGAADYVPVLA